MELTSKNVTTIFEECVAPSVDDPDAVYIDGVVHHIYLLRSKVEKHRSDIEMMIEQLPREFLRDGGGGWSLLNLSWRADGVQWTGLHLVCEQLFALAAALDLAEIQLPRELWAALPGYVPYIVFGKKVEA